ncbi:(deoxy)nucleoside triphosphate pyrophosphohydrolase [Pontibacter flavimaris]|uniref:8-oxo-dGTP diphosphatase n=1 Tax=Pontibacter flavimaris TaxID=1797110 RepID=A0A1Q5PH67_9BACT|nr:(deoxy)nucleoside triphosphate pyrophosphohydrolase [Pontibacter flavimaris]OKL41553.1 NUDIX hydrolase [Pontibacter flavimaris]
MDATGTIKVVCALVEQFGRVLVTQRSEHMREALLWEFPGGKVEACETETACLVREIREELNIAIAPYQRLKPVVHGYPGRTIELIPYLCHYGGGVIRLHEHRSYHWVSPADLANYTWCPADLPVVQEYLQLLKNRE